MKRFLQVLAALALIGPVLSVVGACGELGAEWPESVTFDGVYL